MIVLVDNYDSFTYNLYQYFEELGVSCRVVRNDETTVDEIRAWGPTHIVISPGPGTPDDAGISIDVIRELGPAVPLLGVCLGHQAIAQAFGGNVVRAKRLMHGKTSDIRHDGTGLYAGMTSPFTVARYHSLVVESESLPADLLVTSETADGVIMGMAHRVHPIVGVQFHPESIATPGGKKLLENFLTAPPPGASSVEG